MSAQFRSLQEMACTPMPFEGAVRGSTVSPVALKRHTKSTPGPDPPSRQVVPEHAAVSITGADDVGNVRRSHRPLGVEYSPSALGDTPLAEVPTATQTSFRVQPTFDKGTEMLKAGVPCSAGALDGELPQLASNNAPTPSAATKRQGQRARRTSDLMNSSLSGWRCGD